MPTPHGSQNRTNSRSGRRLGWALGAALAVTAHALPASAHGGLPRAFEIVVEPGDPDDVLLRSDLWGFFRSRDGGKTWQWTCAEVYGANSTTVNHSSFLIVPGGRVLVANAFKGLHVTDDMCGWRENADLQDQLVEDVTLSSGTVFVLTSTYKTADSGTGGGIDGSLWQSKDNGDHFARVAAPLPSSFAGASLRSAASDPTRWYVSGRVLGSSGGTLQHSDDAGATWKSSAFPVTNDNAHLRITGVHPTRPDVVFVWADLIEGLGEDSKDELWATGDGGKTFIAVYKAAGDLPGFAFSPDGTEIAIAGPVDGVRRAKLDDALANGQGAFTQEFSGKVWGLHWSDAGFTAGTDNYTAAGIPAFTYGVSTDQGASFQPLMNICNLQHVACEATSSVGTACVVPFESARDGFLTGRCPDAADAAAPAVPTMAPRKSDSGGNCTVSGKASPIGFLAAATWIALGASLRRRRVNGSRRSKRLNDRD
ncbi:MAG TPA: hypothetical protein VF395_07895 [Polyangiaceae bacterium]